jgi:hypothetical protein
LVAGNRTFALNDLAAESIVASAPEVDQAWVQAALGAAREAVQRARQKA